MPNKNIALSCISLKYCPHILCQCIESVGSRDLRYRAGTMPGQVRRHHFVTQVGEEVQLIAPDVQRAAHSMNEEEHHVCMCALAACDLPFAVDHHCAFGLAPFALHCLRLLHHSSIWVGSRVIGSCAVTVRQLHLHCAVGLWVPIQTVQRLCVRCIAEVLNVELPVAVDGDLALAGDAACMTTVVLHLLPVRDDVSDPDHPTRLHLHKLKAIRRLRGFYRNDNVG